MEHAQPQRRRSPPTRRSAEHRAALAEIARRQHAERRGWEIRPGVSEQYMDAYRRLQKDGMARDQILAQLRPLYSVEARQ